MDRKQAARLIGGLNSDPDAEYARSVRPMGAAVGAAGQVRLDVGDGAVAERFLQLQRRREHHVTQARSVFRIPIFQRCFEVAFEKINRGEKFARVRVLRIQTQRCMQLILRRSKIFLLVGYACQFNQKPRIVWRFSQTGVKRQFRFRPFLQAGQGKPLQKVELRRLVRRTLREADSLIPMSRIEGILRGGQAGLIGRMILSECWRTEHQNGNQKKNHSAFWGTASSIQLRFGRHSFSKSARSSLRSLPRAGSLMKTAPLCQSIPVTTT